MTMRAYELELKYAAKKIAELTPLETTGSVSWKCPSNIAVVKYWGKYSGQIPANSSISMTLKEAVTKIRIDYKWSREIKGPKLNYTFEGKENSSFSRRILSYLLTLVDFMPWLQHTELTIDSANTFPHSAGIASSASAMSALAMGLCEVEEKLFGNKDMELCKRKSSYLARLGSGSASRSVYGQMAIWGKTANWANSSEEYAIAVEDIHDSFIGMKDSILIIESGTKEVSSSLGHDLMKTNPYSKVRFEVAEENMQRMSVILRNGDISQFIDIMENEALTLHSMMMTSQPGYILMKPNTVEAIHRIRDYRRRTGLSIGFTLDAGANVHILYPKSHAVSITNFINSELKDLCEQGKILHDEMGPGPERIKE